MAIRNKKSGVVSSEHLFPFHGGVRIEYDVAGGTCQVVARGKQRILFGHYRRGAAMCASFIRLVSELVSAKPNATVADLLERIMLERYAIHNAWHTRYGLEELDEVEWKWRRLIRSFNWPPDLQLGQAAIEYDRAVSPIHVNV